MGASGDGKNPTVCSIYLPQPCQRMLTTTNKDEWILFCLPRHICCMRRRENEQICLMFGAEKIHLWIGSRVTILSAIAGGFWPSWRQVLEVFWDPSGCRCCTWQSIGLTALGGLKGIVYTDVSISHWATPYFAQREIYLVKSPDLRDPLRLKTWPPICVVLFFVLSYNEWTLSSTLECLKEKIYQNQ